MSWLLEAGWLEFIFPYTLAHGLAMPMSVACHPYSLTIYCPMNCVPYMY